jgi:hypothetical protein
MVPGARWEYNHDKRQLIYNVAAMSGLSFQQAKGLVFKNLGHCLYSQTDLSPRAISMDIARNINRKLGAKAIHAESVKMLMRATEDERSEYRLRTKRYPGLKNGDLPRWDQGYRREWFLKKYEELQRVSPQGAIDKDGNSLYYLRAQTMVRGLVSGALTHDDLPEDMPWSEALCERIAALRKEPTVNGALRKWASLAPEIAAARPVEEFVPPTGTPPPPTPEDGDGEQGDQPQQSPEYVIEPEDSQPSGGSGGPKPDENTQGWGDTEEGSENDKRERDDEPEPNGAGESEDQDEDDQDQEQDNDDTSKDSQDNRQDQQDDKQDQEDDENFADGSGEGLDQPQESDEDESEESDESDEDDDDEDDDYDDEDEDEEDEEDEPEDDDDESDDEGDTDGDPYQGTGAGDEAVDEDEPGDDDDDDIEAAPKDELEEIRDKAKQEPKQQAQGDVTDETKAQKGNTSDSFLGGGAGLGTSELNPEQYEFTPTWAQVVSTVAPYVAPIRKSIERYLKENETVDKVRGYRSGKFDVKAAMAAARNSNDRAYSRRSEKGQRSFAVHVLVDTSSSMGGAVRGTQAYPEIFSKQREINRLGKDIAERLGRGSRNTAKTLDAIETLKQQEQALIDGTSWKLKGGVGSRILMATRMCVAIAEAFRSFQDVHVGYSGFATPYQYVPGMKNDGPYYPSSVYDPETGEYRLEYEPQVHSAHTNLKDLRSRMNGSHKAKILDWFLNFRNSGGTDILPSLIELREDFKKSSAQKKMLIVLSDGEFGNSESDIREAINNLAKDGVEMVVLTVGYSASYAAQFVGEHRAEQITEETIGKVLGRHLKRMCKP